MVLMFLILNYQLSDLHAFIIGLELDFDIVTSAWGMVFFVLVGLFSFFLIALTITATLLGRLNYSEWRYNDGSQIMLHAYFVLCKLGRGNTLAIHCGQKNNFQLNYLILHIIPYLNWVHMSPLIFPCWCHWSCRHQKHITSLTWNQDFIKGIVPTSYLDFGLNGI